MAQTEEELTHARKLASIEARREAFSKSPFWFTTWDLLSKLMGVGETLLKALFWVAFWAVVAQCTCNGCIWHGGHS